MTTSSFRQQTWRNQGKAGHIIQVSNEEDGSLIIAAGWIRHIDQETREPLNPDDPPTKAGMCQPDEHQAMAFTAALMDLMDGEDPRSRSLVAPDQAYVQVSLIPYWETIDSDGDHLAVFKLPSGGVTIHAGSGEKLGKVILTEDQTTEFIQVMLTFTCRLNAEPPKDIRL